MEEKFRRFNIEKSGNLELNRLFTYKIDSEQKTIDLHSPIIFEDNPIKVKSLIDDAMKKLSINLEENPELKNIEKIRAVSTIFYEHPNIFEKYGFEFVEKDEKTKICIVSVAVSKFLRNIKGEIS
jgi:hypothetical protein